MRLFKQFIVRHVFRQPVRSLTTVLGIGLGIAVILAIQMANASSVQGFQSALESISGKTSLEVVSAGALVDERRLLDLEWLDQYGEISPIIEGETLIQLGESRGELVRVLGVDILRDRMLRDYRLVQMSATDEQPSAQDFLNLLIDPHSIVLTEKFARRNTLRIGQKIPLVIGDRVQQFTVRGLLKDLGPARTLDGSFALMDIAAAQWAYQLIGKLTRVDVRLRDGIGIDSAEQQIAARLPDGLSIQRPERRGREVEKMLGAFHFNLTALSYIALLVGLFLIYSTISVSVISRRHEIGILRALGAARRTVLLLFLSEAALFGSAGCVLGLVLARALAYSAVSLTATTVNALYLGLVSAPPPLSWQHVVLAFGIAVPLSLAAAASPGREAVAVTPTDALRGTDRIMTRYRLGWANFVFPPALFLLGLCLSQFGPVRGLPVFGFCAAIVIAFGGASLTPAVLFGLARILRNPLRKLFRLEGRLAHANVAGSIPRLGVSVAALAMSLSMMVAIAVMVGSFRQTVIYWVGQTLQADLFVSPGRLDSAVGLPSISPEVDRIVTQHPAVAAVDRFRRLELPFAGSLVVLTAGDFRVRRQFGNLLFKNFESSATNPINACIGSNTVLVSESFAVRNHKQPGDYIEIGTSHGAARFRIAAVYYDYSSDRGIIAMDNGTFEKYFGNQPPTGLTVYLKPGGSADAVRSEILSALGSQFRLFINTNSGLRREILRIFDSTFAITYALEAIAVFVAILGVATTLLTLILERRRELVILRLLGADRRQIRKMVVIEACLLGAASQGIGIFVGLLLSVLLIYVINVQSFGWTIQFHMPVLFLAQMSVVILIATAVSGIYPAGRACSFDASEEVQQE